MMPLSFKLDENKEHENAHFLIILSIDDVAFFFCQYDVR